MRETSGRLALPLVAGFLLRNPLRTTDRAWVLPDAEGFSFLTSGRIVGDLERSPDSVVFPQNDGANRREPHRSAPIAKGAAQSERRSPAPVGLCQEW